MFDVGFSEVLLLGVIALLVLGPERLPKAARIFGGFVRKARRSFEGIKQEIEREIDADELKKSMAAMPTVASIAEQIKAPFQDISSAIDNERQSVNQGFDDISKDIASVSARSDDDSLRHPRAGEDPNTASDSPEPLSDLDSRVRGNDESDQSRPVKIIPQDPSKPTAA